MIQKTIYNLLTQNTSAPISLSSTNGTTSFPGPLIYNEHAFDGGIYCHVSGFAATVSGVGFRPRLYCSFNGVDWYMNTALPALTTAAHYFKKVTDLGPYIKLGYRAGGKNAEFNGKIVSNARIYLHLNEYI